MLLLAEKQIPNMKLVNIVIYNGRARIYFSGGTYNITNIIIIIIIIFVLIDVIKLRSSNVLF